MLLHLILILSHFFFLLYLLSQYSLLFLEYLCIFLIFHFNKCTLFQQFLRIKKLLYIIHYLIHYFYFNHLFHIFHLLCLILFLIFIFHHLTCFHAQNRLEPCLSCVFAQLLTESPVPLWPCQ